jgi:hypothetical protein
MGYVLASLHSTLKETGGRLKSIESKIEIGM